MKTNRKCHSLVFEGTEISQSLGIREQKFSTTMLAKTFKSTYVSYPNYFCHFDFGQGDIFFHGDPT